MEYDMSNKETRCKFCNNNAVEDGRHFLCGCPKVSYKNIRRNRYAGLKNKMKGISEEIKDVLDRVVINADGCILLAHLRLRSLQGLPVPWENCVASISQWMQSREIQEERLRAWTASTFARLLLIYSRRKRPKELLHTLESDLEELLTDTGKWQGVFS